MSLSGIQPIGAPGVNPAQRKPAQDPKEQRLQRINDLLARVDVLVSQFKFVDDRLKRNLQGTQAKADAVFAKTLTDQQASAKSVSSLLTMLRSSLETYKKQVAGEKSETAETAESLKTIRDTTSQLATETDLFLKAEEAANQGKKVAPTPQQELTHKASSIAEETHSLFGNMDLSPYSSSVSILSAPISQPYVPPVTSVVPSVAVPLVTPPSIAPVAVTLPLMEEITRIATDEAVVLDALQKSLANLQSGQPIFRLNQAVAMPNTTGAECYVNTGVNILRTLLPVIVKSLHEQVARSVDILSGLKDYLTPNLATNGHTVSFRFLEQFGNVFKENPTYILLLEDTLEALASRTTHVEHAATALQYLRNNDFANLFQTLDLMDFGTIEKEFSSKITTNPHIPLKDHHQIIESFRGTTALTPRQKDYLSRTTGLVRTQQQDCQEFTNGVLRALGVTTGSLLSTQTVEGLKNVDLVDTVSKARVDLSNLDIIIPNTPYTKGDLVVEDRTTRNQYTLKNLFFAPEESLLPLHTKLGFAAPRGQSRVPAGTINFSVGVTTDIKSNPNASVYHIPTKTWIELRTLLDTGTVTFPTTPYQVKDLTVEFGDHSYKISDLLFSTQKTTPALSVELDIRPEHSGSTLALTTFFPEKVSVKSDPVAIFEITLPSTSRTHKLEDLVRTQLGKVNAEELDGSNWMTYGDTGVKKPAKTQIRMKALPEMLPLHVKRFDQDLSTKLIDNVQIPERFELELEDGSKATYQRVIIGAHGGGSIQGGHYVSVADEDSQPRIYNDGNVTHSLPSGTIGNFRTSGYHMTPTLIVYVKVNP